ncbi:MAG: CHAP domain-containing protein [Rhizomicrobium sp.]
MLLLNACASAPDNRLASDYEHGPRNGTRIETPGSPLQCVPYARQRSGINLFGDAGTWWDQAAGHFSRNSTPVLGAVMVLTGYAGPGRGHVAVVSRMVSDREIRIDHANWLDDGAIFLDDPVVDVSGTRAQIRGACALTWSGDSSGRDRPETPTASPRID